MNTTWPTALLIFAILGGRLFAQPVSGPSADEVATAWQQLSAVLFAPPKHEMLNAAAADDALRKADLARAFYVEHGEHPVAIQARKVEAIFLIDAVTGGRGDVRGRMQSAVTEFREDDRVPPSERVVVAGTYEFRTAGAQSKTAADVSAEYKKIARALMREFPDQHQGHTSLLTEASRQEPGEARELANEVLASPAAPSEVKRQARRLVDRLELVGQPIEGKIDAALLASPGQEGWRKNRPGLVYFWATWSRESLALGELLAARNIAQVNILGVCLDENAEAAARIAEERKLPGRLVYVANGTDGDLAVKLGADRAPLLYLVNAAGRFTDVRGLDDLGAKLEQLGL